RLEATGMNTDFWGSALVARLLEGMHFAVGPTIAARRGVLQSIGGFERLKDYLAEDFVMGKFAAEAGHGVILSSYVPLRPGYGRFCLSPWRCGCWRLTQSRCAFWGQELIGFCCLWKMCSDS